MFNKSDPINNFDVFFQHILGQSKAIKLLTSALNKNQIAPAYIFSGPNGVGKKLTTLCFLEGLINKNNDQLIKYSKINKNHPDLIWIEPTYINNKNLITRSEAEKEKINLRSRPQIRLEQIKSIKDFIIKKPIKSERGMIVIEDVDYMNESASNALLKTLEEPKHGLFILITERPELLLQTIQSRCQKIIFTRLDQLSIKKIIESERNSEQFNSTKHEELLLMSNGSIGSYQHDIKIKESIPEKIILKLKGDFFVDPIEALLIAKEVNEELNLDQQIWVVKWMQYYIWNKNRSLSVIRELENLRKNLTKYINSRLAWEVTLLRINEIMQ